MKNSPLKLVLLIFLYLTPLIIFNGCRIFGIRENKEPIEWNCYDDGENENIIIDQRVKDLQFDLEQLENTFTKYANLLQNPPKDLYYIYKTRNIFNKSLFLIIPHYDNRNRTIVFIAHKDNFDEKMLEFRQKLQNLEGTYKLYIYLETPNLLYVEKITGAIIYSKVTLSEISIHSNEPSWYYIKGKGTVKSVYLTGHHEIMGIEKSLTVENIYIHSTERLREFTCNMDSTTLFYTNGKIRDKNVFPNLFDKPSKLKKIEMLNIE